MKKKVILMSLSVVVMIIGFIYGVIGKLGTPVMNNSNIIKRESPMITVKEVLQLSTYLNIDGDILSEIMSSDMDRQALEEQYLTMKLFRSVMEVVSINYERKISDIKSDLSYDMDGSKENLGVTIEEFLEFYQVIVEGIPEEQSLFKEKTLYVLGHELGKDNIDYIVTNGGKYRFKDSYRYINIGKDGKDNESRTLDIDEVVDRSIDVLTYQNSIVYMKNMKDEDMVLTNVWIINGSKDNLLVYAHQFEKAYRIKAELPQVIENMVGDITISKGKVTRISMKPDAINGKVLVAGDKYIEIEKYGKLKLSEDFKIYKIYGDLEMEVANNILVGYSTTDFVVADGIVVAALVKEPIKAENIRVMLKTDNFTDIYHNKVTISSDRGMKVSDGTKETVYDAGEEITYSMSENPVNTRLFITSTSENGKLTVKSLNRTQGAPSYRGKIEVSTGDKGLILINEVSIEEYLYSVIPSEMPTSYGLESLKVQAICARSYAHKQLFDNVYSAFGAHVDDSVSYQVYNNIEENDIAIQAVKETYGKVLMYQGEVATAYYFSTSSGHTASIEEVWKGEGVTDYLVGKLQTKYDKIDGETVYVSSQFEKPMDFSNEDVFRNFLKDTSDTTYDSGFPWYRWNVSMSYDNITNSVNKSIGSRYLAAPSNILTLVDGTMNENPRYESKPITSIGTVKNLIVNKREASGIISELIMEGSTATVKVISEYSIRLLLSPYGIDVIRKDNSKISSLNLLPSAYFVMDKGKNSITFSGGGYGHGVGLSQNGVKAMADSGKKYEEILTHYYTGVELGFIYE